MGGWKSRLLLTYEAVVSMAENDRMTELVSRTEEDMKNLYISDASDSHAYIY